MGSCVVLSNVIIPIQCILHVGLPWEEMTVTFPQSASQTPSVLHSNSNSYYLTLDNSSLLPTWPDLEPARDTPSGLTVGTSPKGLYCTGVTPFLDWIWRCTGWAPPLTSLCFLTSDTRRPATTCSGHHVFPPLTGYNLNPWTQIILFSEADFVTVMTKEAQAPVETKLGPEMIKRSLQACS